MQRLAVIALAVLLGACDSAGAAKQPRPQPTFAIPYALEYGPDGALYIADGGLGRVLRYDLGKKRLTVFARGVPEPAQLVSDGSALYVSEIRTNRILRIDRRGRVTKLADVRAPAGLALRSSTLYVSSLESFIVAIDLHTRAVRRIAGDGTPESSGDGRPAGEARVESPHGIEFDPEGNLYLSAGETIRRIDAATGIISTVAHVSAFQFEIAPDGTIYFVQGDPRGGRVLRLEPDGTATTIAGNGTLAGPRALLPSDLLLTRDRRALLIGQTRPFPAVRRLDLRTGRLTTLVRGRR